MVYLPCVIYAVKSTEDKHGSIPRSWRTAARWQSAKARPSWVSPRRGLRAYHGYRGPLVQAEKRATRARHSGCRRLAQGADR